MPVGAVLGFACAFSIIALVAGIQGAPVTADRHRLSPSLADAWNVGATLGALYLPIAYLLFLPKGHVVKAIFVALVVTVVAGVIGDASLGPWAPRSLSASLGFWITVFALYQHHRRNANAGGFGSYFQ